MGTILGTAAYMAPEQAKGKTADRRSDIWSFGVIVYELLTGQRLFQGETAVEILGSVLNKDLDISAAPPCAHKLLRWCLEKDRKKRLASISDALKMLETGDHAPAIIAPTPSKLPWVVATALAVALIGALALWLRGAPRAQKIAWMWTWVRMFRSKHPTAAATSSFRPTQLFWCTLRASRAAPPACSSEDSIRPKGPNSPAPVFRRQILILQEQFLIHRPGHIRQQSHPFTVPHRLSILPGCRQFEF